MPSHEHTGLFLRAALSAALLLASQPCGLSLWPLSLCAFFPMLDALVRNPPSDRPALSAGLMLSFPLELLGHAFLPGTLLRFSGLALPVCVLLWVALALVQCLPLAGGIWLLARIARSGVPVLVATPLVWSGLELITPRVFPSFFGAALYDVAPLLQVAELGGAASVSFVLLSLSCAGFGVLLALGAGRVRLAAGRFVGLGLAAGLVIGLGQARMREVRDASANAPLVRIGLVQPVVDAAQKRSNPAAVLRAHQVLSHSLPSVDLTIWPETALAEPLERDARDLSDVLGPLPTPLLFGALTYDRKQTHAALYNSAVLVDAGGQVLGLSDKTELVPFGEQLPLGERFAWLYDLVPGAGRLTEGYTSALMLGSTRIGALICYEDILPSRVRELTDATRPHLLVNLTNDAWFHAASAENEHARQPMFDASHVHFVLSVLRAIEHRTSLVRATNDGVSAVVGPDGRIERVLRAGLPTAEVAAVRAMPARSTVYGRFGDAPLAVLIGVGLLALLRQHGPRSPAAVQSGRQ